MAVEWPQGVEYFHTEAMGKSGKTALFSTGYMPIPCKRFPYIVFYIREPLHIILP